LLTLRAAVILSVLCALAALAFAAGIALAYSLIREGDESDLGIMTATPPGDLTREPPGEATSDGAPALVTYDASGQYAFPIAADPRQYIWTHTHWDGTNAADMEARFGLSEAEFVQATGATLVAITNGIALNYSGHIGGQGYMLQGDDGLDYYYAHMSQQWVPDGARVTAGQPLGVIGNTGGSAQFLEPHLHLAIGARDTLWTQQPTINSAEWLRQTFGFDWEDRPPAPVTPDLPGGWPVRDPALVIVTPFDQAAGLPQPAIELGFPGSPPDKMLNVIAPLSGEVNVIRWTGPYGTRIQINNDPAQTAVVISGVDEWLVQDGAVVGKGQVIARWNPAHRPQLNYMLYQNSESVDPTPTLGP
jgi:murein DD-endopeptidase MepM/ murein hydrolase activator NlpD